ncbi:MAG: hypothetical protein V2I43_26545 [Parvularcula sp.]|nr:hypothetical protein [Parvularcula sp.]
MRRTLILSMVLTPALAVVAAAQSESFEMVDANADGVLTQAEISAAFGAGLFSRILDAEDVNGDGILTRAPSMPSPSAPNGATTRAGGSEGLRWCGSAQPVAAMARATTLPTLADILSDGT